MDTLRRMFERIDSRIKNAERNAPGRAVLDHERGERSALAYAIEELDGLRLLTGN